MYVVKGPNATGKVFGVRLNKDTQFEAGSEPVQIAKKDVPLIQCYLDSGHLEAINVEKQSAEKAKNEPEGSNSK